MRAEPICRHFGTCGGCAFQDMRDEDYRDLKRRYLTEVLAREGFADPVLEEIVVVDPGTRRRATFKATRVDGEVKLGFHAASSHTVVDMRECRVLTPSLEALVPRLKDMLAGWLKDGVKADLYALDADNGFDMSLRGLPVEPALIAWMARWAPRLNVVRATAGQELLFEHDTPRVVFGRATVRLPPEVFLQPTREGEALLQRRVIDMAEGAGRIADLFCGVGTFSLCLAAKSRVLAIDIDRAALAALDQAARTSPGLKPVTSQARDLLRGPLTAAELDSYDLVVLDPPRAGAMRQMRELVRAKVPRIVYVSCNPSTFARDARILAEGGFRLGTVSPVDQFLWSSHIELVADFSRG